MWEEHFTRGDEPSQIIGKTPAGRATVGTLGMNRPRVLILRLRWQQRKLHPPRV
ncbi:MAG: hypothetical protein NZT92_02005 [Abditibacteriales bacterium]|nr:hypothetical protein [Abditibacteriales bacterium]MDW8364658.1 hypothetical protein [Abditibacteriales bacterium]